MFKQSAKKEPENTPLKQTPIKEPEMLQKTVIEEILPKSVIADSKTPIENETNSFSVCKMWNKVAKQSTDNKRWCPYQNYIWSPYKKNEHGSDALTELSWRLTLWKKENVFPIDLKLRAPCVFFTTILAMKGFLNRVYRI